MSAPAPCRRRGLAAAAAGAGRRLRPGRRLALYQRHPLRRDRAGDRHDLGRSRRRRQRQPVPRGPQQLRPGRAADQGRDRHARRLAERERGAAAWSRLHRLSHGRDRSTTRWAARSASTLREGAAGAVRTLTQYSYDVAGPARLHRGPDEPGRVRYRCPPRPARLARAGRPTAPTGSPATSTTRPASGCSCARASAPRDEAAEATWAYNLNGQVTTVIDGNGNRAELRYDGHGRQDRWTFPSTTRPGRV